MTTTMTASVSMQANPAVGLSQIGQIAVKVKELDRAVAFYRDTLGMLFLFRAPNLAFFNCSGVRLMLSEPEKPEFDHPASIIYYKVDDIHACLAYATDVIRSERVYAVKG